MFTIPFFGQSKGSLPRLSILSDTSQEMRFNMMTGADLRQYRDTEGPCFSERFTLRLAQQPVHSSYSSILRIYCYATAQLHKAFLAGRTQCCPEYLSMLEYGVRSRTRTEKPFGEGFCREPSLEDSLQKSLVFT